MIKSIKIRIIFLQKILSHILKSTGDGKLQHITGETDQWLLIILSVIFFLALLMPYSLPGSSPMHVCNIPSA